jgi:hypothetical protein
MMGVSSTGIAILLTALATAGLALAAILRVRRHKPRPEQWEKAEIMRQLLALSERDNIRTATAPAARLRTSASWQRSRPGNAHLKTAARTTLPVHSKTR